MDDSASPVDLAERVAAIARGLGVETALIGAHALALHGYVRGTEDLDLAAVVEQEQLAELAAALGRAGFSVELRRPDEEDPLGGRLIIWTHSDADGEPLDVVEVVNFLNPYRPRLTPARDAIAHALTVEGKPSLRYPPLAHLVALKLYADSLRDDADIIEVLARNPDADLEQIRSTCKQFDLDRIDRLLAPDANRVRR